MVTPLQPEVSFDFIAVESAVKSCSVNAFVASRAFNSARYRPLASTSGEALQPDTISATKSTSKVWNNNVVRLSCFGLLLDSMGGEDTTQSEQRTTHMCRKCEGWSK